jgi:hypothetical protein
MTNSIKQLGSYPPLSYLSKIDPIIIWPDFNSVASTINFENSWQIPGSLVYCVTTADKNTLRGSIATKQISDEITSYIRTSPYQNNLVSTLQHGAKVANTRAFELGRQLSVPGGITCNMLALVILNSHIVSIRTTHGGDIYLLREDNWHSFFQDNCQNIITSIGENEILNAQSASLTLEPQDRIIAISGKLGKTDLNKILDQTRKSNLKQKTRIEPLPLTSSMLILDLNYIATPLRNRYINN